MAIKRDTPGRELDGAVKAILSEDHGEIDQKREKAVKMTPGQKRKAERDKKRIRRMIDPTPELLALAKEAAKELGVTENQVLNYWAHIGANIATLSQMSEDAESNLRSMRYPYKLRLPKLPDRVKKGR